VYIYKADIGNKSDIEIKQLTQQNARRFYAAGSFIFIGG